MNKNIKLFSVISYITWIGWIIAFVFGDRKDRILKQHLNQALALNIVGILVSTGNRIGGIIGYAATASNNGPVYLHDITIGAPKSSISNENNYSAY